MQEIRRCVETEMGIKFDDFRSYGQSGSTRFFVAEHGQKFFIKYKTGKSAFAMLRAEIQALNKISITETIKVPKVLCCVEIDLGCFTVTDFIEEGSPVESDFIDFGNRLAALHKISVDEFGWEQDNFIGDLPQSNRKHSQWISFYVEERLLPQLQMARQQQYLEAEEVPDKETLVDYMESICEATKPALLHGDLWQGNYIIDKQGVPFLIDPATYFGDSEVDMAMTELFGGFPPAFYEAYYKHFPENRDKHELRDFYRLYYLLVHLNLFGRGYYAQVKEILERVY